MKLRLLFLPGLALGLALAAALPAGASTLRPASAITLGPDYWRESYGSYLIGAPSLSTYDPVEQTADSRALIFESTGTQGHYEIVFNSEQTKCVTADDDGDTVNVKPCKGSDGVVWIAHRGPDGFSQEFESQRFSGKYLAGDGAQGDQFHLEKLHVSGWLYQFCIDGQIGGNGCGN